MAQIHLSDLRLLHPARASERVSLSDSVSSTATPGMPATTRGRSRDLLVLLARSAALAGLVWLGFKAARTSLVVPESIDEDRREENPRPAYIGKCRECDVPLLEHEAVFDRLTLNLDKRRNRYVIMPRCLDCFERSVGPGRATAPLGIEGIS